MESTDSKTSKHLKKSYDIDPFTGNVIDGTEDNLIAPWITDVNLGGFAATDDQVVIDMENKHSENSRMALSWTNIHYEIEVSKEKNPSSNEGGPSDPVKERIILDGVHGQVRPGEILAILGSSGAGKTTLLNILAGRVTTGSLSGQILVNGQRRSKEWKRLSAYVQQDDLLYSTLTVRETISYAARLRLPRTLSSEKKRDLAARLISTLGLEDCADTRIGNAFKRGISGGQKKRTSIGIELVSEPKLLFLDEPTSGLDAFTASSIIETISDIAKKEAKAVIMTIHQPREDILALFDKVLLLSQGKTVFFGPVDAALEHLRSLGLTMSKYTNPADFFLDSLSLDSTDAETTLKTQATISKLHRAWLDKQAKELERRKSAGIPSLLDITGKAYYDKIDEKNKGFLSIFHRDKLDGQNIMLVKNDRSINNYWITELGILLSRDLKEEYREPIVLFGVFFQSLLLLLVFSFTFFQLPLTQPGIQARVGVLFIYAVYPVWSTPMPIFTLFPLARAIMKRERYAASYRLTAAYTSKAVALFPWRFLNTMMLGMGSYYIIGLNPGASNFFIFQAIQLDLIFVAQAIGLLVAALCSTADVRDTF